MTWNEAYEKLIDALSLQYSDDEITESDLENRGFSYHTIKRIKERSDCG